MVMLQYPVIHIFITNVLKIYDKYKEMRNCAIAVVSI